jgi:hypothetical protein
MLPVCPIRRESLQSLSYSDFLFHSLLVYKRKYKVWYNYGSTHLSVHLTDKIWASVIKFRKYVQSTPDVAPPSLSAHENLWTGIPYRRPRYSATNCVSTNSSAIRIFTVLSKGDVSELRNSTKWQCHNCMYCPAGEEVWWKTLLTQEDQLPCPSDEGRNPVWCHGSLVWRCSGLSQSVGP